MAGCGADIEANELIESLTSDNDFTIPEVDFDSDVFKFPDDGTGAMYQEIKPLTVDDLTTRVVDGTGVFDGLMTSIGAHLERQYDKGRIAGAEYTKAYIAAFEGAMGNAVQFLLNKDSAFWQAQTAQIQAITARVQMETAKVQLASIQLEALNQKANYALTKMRLATESANYCIAQFNLTQMLPVQLLTATAEKEGQLIANDTATYNLASMLPQQLVNLLAQEVMLKEQTEAQRAQTLDTRVDGSPVTGVLGKQKDLYAQQITSYQRDSELKAARLWSDAWITQKTIDEGLVPPDMFTNTNVNTVLTTIRNNNNLG